MSQNIDYSKGIYDARQLGGGRMLILDVYKRQVTIWLQEGRRPSGS